MNDILLKLIEFSSWPLLVLSAIFILKDELRKLISRFNGFKAGEIEIKMRQQIHSQGLSDEQLKKISILSTDEIDLFLLVSFTEALGFSYKTPLPKEIFNERLRHMESLGLLKLLPQDKPDDPIGHICTAEGRRIRELIINGASQLLRSSV